MRKNIEYSLKCHGFRKLDLKAGNLDRYLDRMGHRLTFVVEVGDAEDQYGIEEYRSYPYKVITTINARLKKDGLSTIKFEDNEEGLARYIGHICSRDYRFIHQVEIVDLDDNTETNYGKGYWIIRNDYSLVDNDHNVAESGLTLTEAKEYLRNNYHPSSNLSITPDNPEED